MRKAYLDNLRSATVLLVLAYHVCYMFNGVGVLGGIPGAQNLPAFDGLACMVYPWFMVLLFVAAGMSARYSLEKRSAGQFLRERAVKLLVPSTLGLLVLHWITGYLNIKMGGGLAYIPPALIYPIAALSGTGPLWFAQMLFLFSCVLIPLRKLDRDDRLWRWCGKASLPVLLLLFIPVFAAAQVLNLPVLTMYRFGIYLAAFLIGYYVFSHDQVQAKLQAACPPMLVLAAAGAVFHTVRFWGQDYTSPQCLRDVLTNLYLWVAVLAVFGCFGRYLDRETPLSRYLAEASYGLYVLHYPVLITTCYLLCTYLQLPAAGNYAIALLVEFPATFGLYELLRRVPVLRFCVLGMRDKKRRAQS